MSRKPRRYQIIKSLVFHVVNRGILKQDIFHDSEDCAAFKEIVSNYGTKKGFAVYHWCVMRNHYHLVMEIADPQDLSKAIGGIQHVYAVRYHRRYQTAGKLFQGRFKSQAVDKQGYLLMCGRYVERNPVRAGLCQHPWQWKWSSAAFYITGTADGLTTRDVFFDEQFDSPEAYKKFLAAECEYGGLFRSSAEAIGGPGFTDRLMRKDGRLTPRRQGRPIKRSLVGWGG